MKTSVTRRPNWELRQFKVTRSPSDRTVDRNFLSLPSSARSTRVYPAGAIREASARATKDAAIPATATIRPPKEHIPIRSSGKGALFQRALLRKELPRARMEVFPRVRSHL